MFCCFVVLVCCWSLNCCIVFPNSLINLWMSKCAGRTSEGPGVMMRFKEDSWTLPEEPEKRSRTDYHVTSYQLKSLLSPPVLCYKPQLNWAAKTTRMQTNYISAWVVRFCYMLSWGCGSQLTCLLKIEPSDHSTDNQMLLLPPLTTGISSVVVIRRACRWSGHLNWDQHKPRATSLYSATLLCIAMTTEKLQREIRS